MRPELKAFDWYIYGPSVRDIEYCFSLVKEAVADRMAVVQEQWNQLRQTQPDHADDIIDDIAYYSYMGSVELWSFALWRMQGTFEAIIDREFLLTKKHSLGLTARVQAMRAAGYSVPESDRAELLEWSKLRNALSHAPPEARNPASLGESDVMEYRQLIERLIRRWQTEKALQARR